MTTPKKPAPLPWPYAHGREIDDGMYPAAMAVVCLGIVGVAALVWVAL